MNFEAANKVHRYTSSLTRKKNIVVKGLILLFMAVTLIFPGASFRGASTGLLLWFHNVLPSLLPFIIISNLIVRLNITRQISRIFHPILGRLFSVSYEGCYPIVIGFLSGYPMGAKSIADLIADNKINIKEGQFLLGLCNNASPMFILSYIGITQLKLTDRNYVILSIIYCSAIIGALLYRRLFIRPNKELTINGPTHPSPEVKRLSNRFSFDLLDKSIINGFEIVTKIGGYIILFSIIAQIIREIGPETSLFKVLIIGILEITTGISQIAGFPMDMRTKIVLVSVLTSFGGLSAVAQTKSVLGDTRLSISSYIVQKILCSIAALILSLIYVTVFSIR